MSDDFWTGYEKYKGGLRASFVVEMNRDMRERIDKINEEFGAGLPKGAGMHPGLGAEYRAAVRGAAERHRALWTERLGMVLAMQAEKI